MKNTEEHLAEIQQLVDEESIIPYSLNRITRNQELKILVLEQQSNVQKALNTLEQLECSQLGLENKAFETINCADTALNMVKEGIQTMEELISKMCTDSALNNEITRIRFIMKSILDTAYQCNDMSRNLEHEVALQREITDSTKQQIELLSESIERAGYYFEEY
ncbi:MAG: hypothetical protein K0R92_1496 [Lachnospiraceae bacterium]|jgi:hypothetical protein|nr:hypothetical protein [Lachnospiraceae bacterium]